MIRVVQWATGPVGRHAVAAVADHPDLDLVGALVYSPDKAGRDVGDISGTAPLGVVATTDKDEILGLDAHCVLYMAQGDANPAAALDDICAILVSGKNVVSTAVTPLIDPRVMGSQVVQRLEAACQEGGATFHATGIEPGWASNVLPLAMSGIFRYVESLTVQELLDYSTYDNAFMLFDVMGFGRAPDDSSVIGAEPSVLAGVFRAAPIMLADAMGGVIEDYEYDRRVWLADEPFDVAAGRIEVGTVAALRFSVTGIIDGRRALTVEHVTRLRPDDAPDWPRGRGWKVSVEGLPSMVLEAKIAVHDEDENDQGCLGTAMVAVNAIGPVVAAEPGIRTYLDLPMIVGNAVLRPPSWLST